MPPYSSKHVTPAEISSPGEDEASGEDDYPNRPEARDSLEWIQTPPSPSFSISTTVSELELEQGDALLQVKKLKAEEDLDHLPSDPEVSSSDRDNGPVPKKRKMDSIGAKPRGKKKKSQQLAGKVATDTNRRRSGSKGKKRTKSARAVSYSDEDSSKEERLQLDCVLPIQGINWPVVVPVTTPWSSFLLNVARELNVKPEEIKLSYRFSSFTAAENSEVLCTQDHYRTMITKAKDFLTGKKRVRGGKDFRVHLAPVFKNPLPTPAVEAGTSKKGAKKKGKLKAKAVEDSEDETEKKNEKAKTDKLSIQLALKNACGVSGHEVCWIDDEGKHIQLAEKDLSSWALWIGWGRATESELPKVLVKKWKREQARKKSLPKSASKASRSSPKPRVTNPSPEPIKPPTPIEILTPPTQPATAVHPPTFASQDPSQLHTLHNPPGVTNYDPTAVVAQSSDFFRDVQPYRLVNRTLTTPTQHPIPYNSVMSGPNSQNFPMYPQNPHQHHPSTETYRPVGGNQSVYPITSTSYPQQPAYYAAVPERQHPTPSYHEPVYHEFHRPAYRPEIRDPYPYRPEIRDPYPYRTGTHDPHPYRTDFRDPYPYRTEFRDPWQTGSCNSYHTGSYDTYHTNFRDPPHAEPYRTEYLEPRRADSRRSLWSGSIEPRQARSPQTRNGSGPTGVPTRLSSNSPHNRPGRDHQEDVPFPTLQDWFSSIDNDRTRSGYQDQFSEYSHAFELRGLTTLLDLEGLEPGQLFDQFGLSEAEARRLLTFAEEDIRAIRRSSTGTPHSHT